MNLAERILALRKARNLSQEELAEQIGVSRQAVGKWESGQSQPDLDKIIALSEFFGVSCDYLLKGSAQDPQAGTEAGPAMEEQVPPNACKVILWIATFFNCSIYVLSVALWRQFQTPLCTAVAFLGLGAGTFFFLLVTHMLALKAPDLDVRRCRLNFWRINIWLLALPVMAQVQNLNPFSFFSPFPMVEFGIVGMGAWGLYLVVCLAVTFLCGAKRRRLPNPNKIF